jgi:hypothetical protein
LAFGSTIATAQTETTYVNNAANIIIIGTQAANPAPIANNDTVTTTINTPVFFTVTGNDSESDTGQSISIS